MRTNGFNPINLLHSINFSFRENSLSFLKTQNKIVAITATIFIGFLTLIFFSTGCHFIAKFLTKKDKNEIIPEEIIKNAPIDPEKEHNSKPAEKDQKENDNKAKEPTPIGDNPISGKKDPESAKQEALAENKPSSQGNNNVNNIDKPIFPQTSATKEPTKDIPEDNSVRENPGDQQDTTVKSPVLYDPNLYQKFEVGGIIFEGESIKTLLHGWQLNGKGKIIYPEGFGKKIEEGIFENNVLVNGIRTDQDETTFIVKNKLLSGNGTLKIDNRTLTGEIKNSMLNGRGTMTSYDKYNELTMEVTGYFIDNKLEGEGKRYMKIGFETKTEMGKFKNDVFIEGTITTSSIGKFEGKFKDDKLVDGKKDFERVGPNIAPWGKVKTEEGLFENDLLHGQGSRTYVSGLVEKGSFKNGNLHEGSMTFASGKAFSGKFEDGILVSGKKDFGDHGFDGPDIAPWGKVKTEEGSFKNTHLHGQGSRTFACGIKFSGTYKNGKFLNGKKDFGNRGPNVVPHGKVKTEEGLFENDLLHGQGKIIYVSGYVEEGQFHEGIKQVSKQN